VFDGKEGYPNEYSRNVVFTKNESADNYIKRFIKTYNNKSDLIIVSNDRELIDYAKSYGVKTIKPSDFFKEKRQFYEKNDIDYEKITEEIRKEWGL
jgi:predicted RNA-binding protein with PIN domain